MDLAGWDPGERSHDLRPRRRQPPSLLVIFSLVVPAAGTFLNFVSYAAGGVRLAALSHQRVIWVATHDS
ncbi:hypothetical protein BCR35DRAFT_332021 [Leucosporidium creatinivorum]|uniref:Uncharacterized protein n=1 Tax=Leucosporidium creatinivorum TaxID=106004 RepID=A0A1Y2F7A6_9BASI|nr:hypothetical protein BCR35DRAFT_332021 [Leucosporidium creatinivorum]